MVCFSKANSVEAKAIQISKQDWYGIFSIQMKLLTTWRKIHQEQSQHGKRANAHVDDGEIAIEDIDSKQWRNASSSKFIDDILRYVVE